MRIMDVDELKPHPKNNYFFDDIDGESWLAFLESIKTSGVIEPVIIDASDKTIVSGHQRVRACKELEIKRIAVEERGFESEDERLKQLIETNIRQRGVGNTNPVKFGRCIAELERIYGIRHGGDRVSESKTTNGLFGPSNQSELANDLGVDKKTLQRAKKLAELPEEIQQMVMDGKITASTASRVISRLSPEEQQQIAESIGGADKVSGKEVEKYIAEIRAKDSQIQDLEFQNQQLHSANKALARQANQGGKVEVVEKEVFPSDYKTIKSKAFAYDAETARLNGRIAEINQEKRNLEERIHELEKQTIQEQTHNDTVASAIYFTAQCGSFIRDVGGYVWLADKLNELPDRERELYVKSALAIRDWALVLLQNIERSDIGREQINTLGDKG